MEQLPTGTITFLLTDIEGSTGLWEQHPDAMRAALLRHDEIIEGAVKANGGFIVRPRGEGDSRFAVFVQAQDGVRAAVEIQHTMVSSGPTLPFALKVRIGIHTGAADLRMGDYYGSTVNRCARIRGLGHGGQTLVSQATAELVRDDLAEGVELVDLGLHQLKGLSRDEKIYQLWIPGLPNDFPPLNSPEEPRGNLPIPATPFVGREREVAEAVGLLNRADVRLLTLTGTGGTGKTRLSLEVARNLLDLFAHGVFFIDLSPITNPALVATTIAHTMGIREGGGRPPLENLKEYLADKNMLLIFDNFEQVVAAAPLVAELLSSAPKIKVLATSRIALQLRGEHELPVAPLRLPEIVEPRGVDQALESEAVKLFVQQARAVNPGFKLTPENAPIVASICRRLDGLPLAIEIAAARIKMLPPQALFNRLDQSLKLLVGGAVDLPARHQTLRNAIDWSYNLLKPEEQRLFACLSVFVGGFLLESAESVCAAGDDGQVPEWDFFAGVEALFNLNLLRQAESVSGEPRFYMLQTIRDYALEKLAESGSMENLRRAHAEYFTQKGIENEPLLYGPQAMDWLARLDEEIDNYRAALSFSLEPGSDASMAAWICLALNWFWYRHGHIQEGRGWSERAAAATQSTQASPPHIMALYLSAMMSMWEGDLHSASAKVEEGNRHLHVIPDEKFIAIARMSHGIILLNQGRDLEAYAHLVSAAELFDQVGERWFLATTLVHLANVALGLGQFEDAINRLNHAMPTINEFGDRWQIAFCLNNFGEVARTRGDYEEARRCYQRTEASFREADAMGDQARLTHTFGYLALHQGAYEQAWNQFQESLTQFRVLGNRRGIAECLAGLAGVAAEQGHHQWAAPLLCAAESLLTKSGSAWWPADRVEIERSKDRLRSVLDGEEYDALWKKGQSMDLDSALSYATENAGLPI